MPTSQTTAPRHSASASPAPSAEEARAIVEELAACGTRHSLSSWTDPKRGIGCGRDAVLRRLRAIAGLEVAVDRFETKSARTKDSPVPMENVIAVLPGSDPRRKTAVYVVSGHLDSMPSDNTPGKRTSVTKYDVATRMTS